MPNEKTHHNLNRFLKDMKTKKQYKFLRTGLKSDMGKTTWKVGKWKKFNGKLEMCKGGFHCSKRIIDAFLYVQGEILALVEVRGKSIVQNSKEVWPEMTWRWTKKDNVALAVYAAEQVIDIFEKEYPNDKRPREAIKAAKRYLRTGSRKGLAAAGAAAWAAGAAAWAARDAAWAAGAAAWAAGAAAWAARDAAGAARDAAWAARDAAGAARDAAWAAEAAARDAAEAARDAFLDKIDKWMMRRIKEKSRG